MGGKHSAAAAATKPRSMNSQNKHFQTAGEILNYPYSFDGNMSGEDDQKYVKKQYEE